MAGAKESSAQSAETVLGVFHVDEADTIVVPPTFPLFKADFVRAGPDLVLTAPQRVTVVIQDFFATAEPPDLADAGGGHLSGMLAARLAGPPAPGQYAQVAGAGQLEPIGQVDTLEGSATAVRADGSVDDLQVGDALFQGDVVATAAKSAVGILFADESVLSVGDDSRIVLDEMVYDPGGQQGEGRLSLIEGVFVYVSGAIAKTDPDAMVIETPVASIGIRGTAVGLSYDVITGIAQVGLFPEVDPLTGASFTGEIAFIRGSEARTINTAGSLITVRGDEVSVATVEASTTSEIFGSAFTTTLSGSGINGSYVAPTTGGDDRSDITTADDVASAADTIPPPLHLTPQALQSEIISEPRAIAVPLLPGFDLSPDGASATSGAEMISRNPRLGPTVNGPLGLAISEDVVVQTIDLLSGALTSDPATALAVADFRQLDGRPTPFTLNGGALVFESGSFSDLRAGTSETVVFGYQISDGSLRVPQVLTVRVDGINDPPTVDGPLLFATHDNAGIAEVDLLAGANDVDVGDVLAVRNLRVTEGSVVDVRSSDDGTFRFDTAQFDRLGVGDTESLSLEYQVSDGRVDVPQSLTIHVEGANDAPVAQDDRDLTSSFALGDLLTNDVDAEGDPLSVVSINGVAVPAPQSLHFALGGSNTTRSVILPGMNEPIDGTVSDTIIAPSASGRLVFTFMGAEAALKNEVVVGGATLFDRDGEVGDTTEIPFAGNPIAIQFDTPPRGGSNLEAPSSSLWTHVLDEATEIGQVSLPGGSLLLALEDQAARDEVADFNDLVIAVHLVQEFSSQTGGAFRLDGDSRVTLTQVGLQPGFDYSVSDDKGAISSAHASVAAEARVEVDTESPSEGIFAVAAGEGYQISHTDVPTTSIMSAEG